MAEPPKADDELMKRIKEEVNLHYHTLPYDESDREYIVGEFRWSSKKIVNLGSNQVFRGLADTRDVPHGWGVLQHHNGIAQDCAAWTQGVPNGRGVFRDPEGGVFYGTWRNGKREGWGCSVDKEHKMFLECYEDGKLAKKIKWKLDKEHLKCAGCGTMYLEKTNKTECRYHPDPVNWEDRYSCCGALAKHNPQGCTVDFHRVNIAERQR
eukprot:TRINITY_DN60956_c0_g1_i1.p1 TRINITY_DN60956_c0_g1~~TRINITY_DN60956_c0_g1_i1.p1  ORF type:complete len:209 (+),score=30.05 TRINITY_DN60956_c0_g1_i1:25-651(+)